MKTLSLKLDEAVFEETEKLLLQIKIPRNRYINDAIRFYNLHEQARILAEQLAVESKLVQEESMSVLKEFEATEDYDGW